MTTKELELKYKQRKEEYNDYRIKLGSYNSLLQTNLEKYKECEKSLLEAISDLPEDIKLLFKDKIPAFEGALNEDNYLEHTKNWVAFQEKLFNYCLEVLRDK